MATNAADYFSLEGVTDLLDVVEEMRQETRHASPYRIGLSRASRQRRRYGVGIGLRGGSGGGSGAVLPIMGLARRIVLSFEGIVTRRRIFGDV